MNKRTPGITSAIIVEEILTQHWKPPGHGDLYTGCRCWVCVEAVGIGLRADPDLMPHRRTTPQRGHVHVDPAPRFSEYFKQHENYMLDIP